MSHLATPDLNARQHDLLRRLCATMRGYGAAVVALSGGVDSTLVAALAARELGPRALAVTGRSPSLAALEEADALRVAAAVGIAHHFVDTRELDRPGYVANAGNRCFFCKDELYGHLDALAAQRGAVVVDGVNADDRDDDRPGHAAAAAHGVRHPLREAGCTKADVRALARALALPTWDKPAMPCLASRIPTGTPVSVAILEQIEAAEAFLRGLGLRDLRVRHLGARAHVETDEAGRDILRAEWGRIEARFTALGYVGVSLGLRTGPAGAPPWTAVAPSAVGAS